MAEKVMSLVGVKTPEGPSAAEQAVQTAQRAQAEREAIRARSDAAVASAAGSLRGALSYDDRRRKSSLGG